RSRKKKINRHTLANTLEAVAAAIFLDSGKCYATVSRVVVPLLFPDAAPARQVEKATEPVVTAEAPVLSVEDVERLSRLLDVATSLPPLPPSPNDLEEARAPDQGSPRTILELLNQVGAGNGHGLRSALNRRQILVQTVYRRLGVKPEFLVRAQDDGRGKAGKRQGNGQVVVDVQVRVGENTCLLGSGQGDSRQSAITDVATRLLANTRKLSHLLSHLQ
ncbi:MAG TPA: hypothetical protein VJ837_02255, partial [Candidatus Paceibacterota bacterium]|nr:hypothetical protein [Candidatus Paceibacterota bacterium]